MGTIYNSKFRSGHLISMSPKFKYKDTREKYPGPGTYIRFSELFPTSIPNSLNRI